MKLGNLSLVSIMDSEILHSIQLPGENPNTTHQTDISLKEQISEATSVSPSADREDKRKTVEQQQNETDVEFSYKKGSDRKYNREFLLQLQSQPMSSCKPDDLPNLDEIKYEPDYDYLKRSNQGKEDKEHIEDISLIKAINDQRINLHKSPNPWRPLHKCAVPFDEKERLKKTVLGVLNKLTPQKFEILLTQLKSLNIDTEEKLTLVTNLIFEKAVNEPKFSVPYANLCRHLCLIKVPVSGKSGTQVNFRKLLLIKCQKEFEQYKNDELKNEEKMKTLEAADPEKRKELQLEYEEKERKFRKRQLGNIRLIGELFKLNMLIEPILHECIERLLRQGHEKSLECLSVLLTTVGKELDSTKANKYYSGKMEIYFSQIKGIIEKRLTSFKVRFMLQDVIDLKKNNWVPRKKENNPKTIAQIRNEVQRESYKQQLNYKNIINYATELSDDRNRQKYIGLKQFSKDGILSSENNKDDCSKKDPFELKLTKKDEEGIRLNPGERDLQSNSTNKSHLADFYRTILTKKFSVLTEQSLSSSYKRRSVSQLLAASSHECGSQFSTSNEKNSSVSKDGDTFLDVVKGLIRTTEDTTVEVTATADFQENKKSVTPDGDYKFQEL